MRLSLKPFFFRIRMAIRWNNPVKKKKTVDGAFCNFRYQQMVDWLGRPFRSVPRHPVRPLKVSISKKLKEVVGVKVKNAGAEKGKYIVIHGLESDSKASMQSKGDADSLLPLTVWAEIAEGIR